jgi:large subunit ribosomal protein L29
MPILRIKEILDMSSEDRQKRISELRTELVRLTTMIKAGGAVENPAHIKQLRRAIAKLLTIEREERLGIRKAKAPKKRVKKAK